MKLKLLYSKQTFSSANWKKSGRKLIADWKQTGCRLEVDWKQNGSRPEAYWKQTRSRMKQNESRLEAD